MKRAFSGFLALLLILPTPAAAREPASAGPALWAVKDADTTIYLFGTMHLLPPGTDWLKPETARRFDSADTIVLEVAPSETKAEEAALVHSLGFSPNLPPLKARLDPARARKLEEIMRGSGLPAAALDKADTWLAGLTLTMIEMVKLGMDPDHGVEEQLTARAEPAGKTILGLETAEEQIRMLDSMSEADQRATLADTIDEYSKIKSQLTDMLKAWLTGDAEGIAAQMNDELKDTPHLAKLLLTDRNARWAKWIEKRMAQPGTVFIAVGAGHLAGPGSVQSMLAKRGLKAERVAD